ncbi:MAG: nitrilase-related carbon-nitrogen hydrolase [Pseudomonadota bacterium]
MRVAVLQTDWADLDRADRLDRLDAAADACSADVLVTPELSLSGYAIGDALSDAGETCDGPSLTGAREVARRHGVALVVGWVEVQGDQRFNVATCVGHDGRILGHHRKTILPPGFERRVFSPGRGMMLFQISGVTCALLICYEVEIAECARAIAASGAELVLAPTALSADWPIVAHRMIPTRAFENSVAIAYANHTGKEGETRYLGASCIVAPDGQTLARADSDAELIEADIVFDRVAMLRERLPYGADAGAAAERLRG